MRRGLVLIALLVAASLHAAPVAAGPILFTDPAGDANLVNDQGLEPAPIPDAGPDTRPVSVGSADLVEARYETTYVSVPERDAEGRIVAVRRVPTGLRVRIRTALPAAPSFGPTVATEVRAEVEGCPVIFLFHTHGTLSAADDPAQGSELRTQSPACPDGARTYAAGISLDLNSTMAVIEAPFSALQTPSGPILAAGDVIAPDPSGPGATTAAVRGAPNGLVVVGPFIDKATPVGTFTVGADLPPDIDCLAEPAHPACTDEISPDTRSDLHDILLGTGPAARTTTGDAVDMAEEFVTFSFRPDGRWLASSFDIAGAELDGAFVEVNLAARLVRDGTVNENWLPISRSFAQWKLLYGPADDPYRFVTTLSQDTPYGVTISLPAEGLDRLTLLAGADVDLPDDVAFVLAVRGNDDGFVGEPFPDAFGQWMAGWTGGMRKVRLVPDRWGHGVALAARLAEYGGLNPTDVRRGVTVEDDRTRLTGSASPGTMNMTAELTSSGAALADTWLFYVAQADQDIAIEWSTPAGARRGQRTAATFSGASLNALVPDAGAGPYRFRLEVDSGAESSSSLGYIQSLWSLDPTELFPGITPSFVSDPAAEPVVLSPGEWVDGPAPALVVSMAGR